MKITRTSTALPPKLRDSLNSFKLKYMQLKIQMPASKSKQNVICLLFANRYERSIAIQELEKVGIDVLRFRNDDDLMPAGLKILTND